MPTSVLEAYASGLPVVATAAGGVPAILTDGEHGLLAPADDHQAVAAGVLRLLADPALVTRLTVQARAPRRVVHLARCPESLDRRISQCARRPHDVARGGDRAMSLRARLTRLRRLTRAEAAWRMRAFAQRARPIAS